MAIFGDNTKVFTTVSGPEMEAIIRELGFVPELSRGSSGVPVVRFSIEGMKNSLLFYGVEGDRARSLQFFWGINAKLTHKAVNEWNMKKRFGKAYVDSDGDAVIEMDVDLDGGVRRDYLKEIVLRWKSVVTSYARYVMENDTE